MAFTCEQFYKKCYWIWPICSESTLLKLLSHFPRDKESTRWDLSTIAVILQMSFSNAFSWKKILAFGFIYHPSLFPVVNWQLVSNDFGNGFRAINWWVPLRSRHFLSQKLWHFLKNTRSCVKNECCCPRTVSISNVNFTLKIYHTSPGIRHQAFVS